MQRQVDKSEWSSQLFKAEGLLGYKHWWENFMFRKAKTMYDFEFIVHYMFEPPSKELNPTVKEHSENIDA